MSLLSALGYIDPTSVTIIFTIIFGTLGGLTTIIAVVAMILAVIGVIATIVGVVVVAFVIKAKRKAARVLHIDVNANKEVEDELVINTEDNK